MTKMQAVDNERQALISRFLAARAETDALFDVVKPEAIYDRPIPERHRIVFYIGHLEAFDWNLLGGLTGVASTHVEFDRLFAFGIDPVGGNLPTDRPEDWPRREAVADYRHRVRQEVDDIVAEASRKHDNGTSFRQLLNVAIEHRLMHAETLSYILHQLPFERKNPPEVRKVLQSGSFTPDTVRIPAGKALLGLRRDSLSFGWDNEFEEHGVHIPEFTIDRYKTTNSQFLRFVEAGGYQNRDLWTPHDWKWRTERQISHPVFWVRRGGGWSYRSMFEEIPLPADWPVYVSHAEASAYTRWAGKSLPTEAEWQRAAYGNAGSDEGDDGTRHSNAQTWDPSPVNHKNVSVSAFGVEGMIANGWEWTSTEFAPFPGFRAFASYPGYSEPFFDGQHYVLKGGSVRTAPCMLRRSFRNWFQPHYQYVYSGFRCATKAGTSGTETYPND